MGGQTYCSHEGMRRFTEMKASTDVHPNTTPGGYVDQDVPSRPVYSGFASLSCVSLPLCRENRARVEGRSSDLLDDLGSDWIVVVCSVVVFPYLAPGGGVTSCLLSRTTFRLEATAAQAMVPSSYPTDSSIPRGSIHVSPMTTNSREATVPIEFPLLI